MPQNSPFLLHFSVFAQFLFRMRLFAAGLSGWVGALWGGMAGLRRTVPVFSRRNGYTAPLQTVCGVCGGGCVFSGLHALQRDAVPPPPLQRGVGLLQICHSLFCPPPCPAPDSRFPIADFYLRQLPAFKLSCVNCNPSRAILCGTYLRQHRTIPALRLKHRSGSCGTASALPKCSIRHPVLSALLAWHLPHLARRIGT